VFFSIKAYCTHIGKCQDLGALENGGCEKRNGMARVSLSPLRSKISGCMCVVDSPARSGTPAGTEGRDAGFYSRLGVTPFLYLITENTRRNEGASLFLSLSNLLTTRLHYSAKLSKKNSCEFCEISPRTLEFVLCTLCVEKHDMLGADFRRLIPINWEVTTPVLWMYLLKGSGVQHSSVQERDAAKMLQKWSEGPV